VGEEGGGANNLLWTQPKQALKLGYWPRAEVYLAKWAQVPTKWAVPSGGT